MVNYWLTQGVGETACVSSVSSEHSDSYTAVQSALLCCVMRALLTSGAKCSTALFCVIYTVLLCPAVWCNGCVTVTCCAVFPCCITQWEWTFRPAAGLGQDRRGGGGLLLVGEVLAEFWGYAGAFLFLSAVSLLPLVLYSVAMPAAVSVGVSEEAGGGQSMSTEKTKRRRVVDHLSVASHHGGSVSALGGGDSSTHSNVSSAWSDLKMQRSFAAQRTSGEEGEDERRVL